MNQQQNQQSDDHFFHITSLIAGHIRKSLSKQEETELNEWLALSEKNRTFFESLTNQKNIEANLQWMEQVYTGPALRRMKEQLAFNPEKPTMLHRLKPYLAAAAILLMLAAITYFQSSGPTRESVPDRREVYGNHIHSGKAILTLEDGRSINLEQAGMGAIGNDHTIRKIGDNALSYSMNTDDLPVAYHTLSTQAGTQYSVTLSDGTRVQLNTQSSLHFPISFDSSYRVVELSGEGYFEVAKNTAKPFIVQMPGGASIKVLGTQFNVMVYPEEANQKITLAEGSVLVTSASSRRQMKPGEMATIDKGYISTSNADLQKELAWTRNEFLFRNTRLDEICRHLSRWYDVEVVSTANPAEKFSASFPKAWPLEKIMGYLEATGKLHFKLEGKKLRVSNRPF